MDVAAEEARLGMAAYKDRIALVPAAAIRGWLIADGRMPGSELLATLAASHMRHETESEDGFKVAEHEEALAAEHL